jgi:hypothetical protein
VSCCFQTNAVCKHDGSSFASVKRLMPVSNVLESQDFHIIFYLSRGNVIKITGRSGMFRTGRKGEDKRKEVIMYTYLYEHIQRHITYTHT